MTKILSTVAENAIHETHMGALLRGLNNAYGLQLKTAHDLHQFSIQDMERFWDYVADDLGIVFHHRGMRILDNPDTMVGGQFFTDSTLNYAQNMLPKTGNDDCLIYGSEDYIDSTLSWDDVHAQVSQIQQCLVDKGIGVGDVVGGIVPNCPQAIIAMLATTSLGAVWTSCSPDFGVNGILDRFSQTKPKILFVADGYYYNSKRHICYNKAIEVQPQIDGCDHIIIFNNGRDNETVSLDNPSCIFWQDIIKNKTAKPIAYTPVPFNAPVFILYSSGTTGVPKCIVHCVGGALLSNGLEHKYHANIDDTSRVFFYTTCGWMMWNWLGGAMARGAVTLLYDGSPFAPRSNILFDFMAGQKATFMGISAKFIEACQNKTVTPNDDFDLSSIKTVGSTGSVLSPDGFQWIYDNISDNVYISSLSGGTDICGCFYAGNPLLPVHKGELVSLILGKDVQIWNDDGTPINKGVGELVCVSPFPAMPIYFWGDDDGSKYRNAYFAKFPNVWCHGDFVERTDTGYIIHGRSDAVLNPGGVRIGTAEIYNQIQGFPEIIDSVVIGQPYNHDVRVVLFVVLSDGVILNHDLIETIKTKIRQNCTPRHVPAVILAVDDIPRTRSGKISELAVRDVVIGRPINNKTALANPESLDLFKDRPELQT